MREKIQGERIRGMGEDSVVVDQRFTYKKRRIVSSGQTGSGGRRGIDRSDLTPSSSQFDISFSI